MEDKVHCFYKKSVYFVFSNTSFRQKVYFVFYLIHHSCKNFLPEWCIRQNTKYSIFLWDHLSSLFTLRFLMVSEWIFSKFLLFCGIGVKQLLRNTMSTNWFFDNFEKDHHHFHLVHNGTNWLSGQILYTNPKITQKRIFGQRIFTFQHLWC